MEVLACCDYCSRRGRKRNLAKVTWLVNGQYNHFCPHCLNTVLKSMIELPWTQEHGYKVEYPYQKGE